MLNKGETLCTITHLIQSSIINQHLRTLNRNFIGFEPTLRRLTLSDSLENSGGYPPYNLEVIADNHYRITLAVAGFKMEELDITLADNKLTISGTTSQRSDNDVRTFVHKGIAERSFTRSFILADHVNITGAELENGLLTIDLEQEIPEALKPRKIAIKHKDVIDATPVKSSKA